MSLGLLLLRELVEWRKPTPETTHVINTGSKDNDDNGNLILVDKNKIYMVTYIDIYTIFRGEGTIFAEGGPILKK